MPFNKTLKEIGKHGSIYSIGWTVNAVIRLGLLPVFTRYLDKSEYGTLAILDSAIEIIRILCALGLSTAIIRFYHEYENEIERNKTISTGILISIIVVCLSSVFLYFLRLPLTNIVLGHKGSTLYFSLCAGSMVLSLLRIGTDSYFITRKASLTFVFVNSGYTVTNSCLNLYLVIVKDMGVLGVLLGNLITAIIVNTILLIIVLKRVSWHLDVSILVKMLKFGLPLVLSLIAAAGMHNIDRLFIRVYASIEDVRL